MVAFICVIIWIIVTPCIAVICGLSLKKKKVNVFRGKDIVHVCY